MDQLKTIASLIGTPTSRPTGRSGYKRGDIKRARKIKEREQYGDLCSTIKNKERELRHLKSKARQRTQNVNGGYSGAQAKRDGRPRVDRDRAKQYGISPDDYDQLMSIQGNKCAICRKELDKPCIDHCHTHGQVRGVLCPQCNTGLGMFYDNPESLRNAVKYLEVWYDK